MALIVCALALGAGLLRAQEGPGTAAPPPDNGAAAPASANGGSDNSASFQTFYDGLASQGTWIQSDDYGYVWQPDVNDPDWAPYTDGHWVYTDDGWTWVSDESWGWATYHYGRWANLDGTGWVWVPGYTWAPAWVSWRYGGGYCGWAPLPPDSFLGIDYGGGGFAFGIGFHIGGDCDGFYGIGAGCYRFLPVGYLGYGNYHNYYAHRYDNYGIINHTTNVTNVNVTRGRGGATTGATSFSSVTTGGPSLSQVNAVSQFPVQKVALVRSNQPGGGGTLVNNSLALYAPRVNSGTTAQPAHVARSIGRATVNRGTDITHPLAVNQRLTPAPATEDQVQLAREAQDHAPASAKVVTALTLGKPVLNTPLTSLKPISPPVTATRTSLTPSTISETEHTPSATTEGGGGSTRVYPPGEVYHSTSSSTYPHPGSSETPHESTSHSSGAPSYSPSGGSGYHPSSGGGGSHGSSGGGSRGGGGSSGSNGQQGH